MILKGWKAIADYIGKVSVITAKRYYYDKGMPVHGVGMHMPFAFSEELDLWHKKIAELLERKARID